MTKLNLFKFNEDISTLGDLFSSIHTCLMFSSPATTNQLQILLRQNSSVFTPFLNKKPPNSCDREKVNKLIIDVHGTPCKLSSDFANKILRISDHLKLNEIESNELLWRAHHLNKRFPDLDLEKTAIQLFYNDRIAVIYSLVLLFCFLDLENKFKETSQLIYQFILELLSNDLISYILNLIEENIESTDDYKMSEIHALCRLLLYVSVKTKLSFKSVLMLLNLLSKLSYSSSSNEKLLNINYLIVSIIICNLDLSQERILIFTRPDTMDIMEFIKSFANQIKNSKFNSTFNNAIIHLIWGLFLVRQLDIQKTSKSYSSSTPSQYFEYFNEEYIESLINYAISSDFIVSLVNLMQNPVFINDPDKIVLISLYDELIRSLLNNFSEKIFEIKRIEEDLYHAHNAYSQYPTGPAPAQITHHFKMFVYLIHVMYESQPTLSIRFWQKQEYPNFYQFIRISCDNLFMTENSIACFLMIGSLASDKECALHAFEFLKNTSRKYFNWNYIFEIFDKYYKDNKKSAVDKSTYYHLNQSHLLTTPTTSSKEINNFKAILYMMQRITKSNKEIRTAILSNPEWHALEVLFKLLTCPVDPSFKACIVDVITQFARDPSAHQKIWEFLDAIQILPTSNLEANQYLKLQSNSVRQSSNFGIRFDLYELESEKESYVYTLSFLNLLDTLLAGYISNFGNIIGSVNIITYLNFVFKDVFELFDNRAYKNLDEPWLLARTCLNIFLSLINKSTFFAKLPSNLYNLKVNLGTEKDSLLPYKFFTLYVFKYFLQNSNVLKKVFSILNNGLLDSTFNCLSPQGLIAFQDCIQNSLLVIQNVLQKQNLILDSDLYSIPEFKTGMLTPLDELLLSNYRDVTSIAEYLSHPSEFINQLSVSILQLLSTSSGTSSKIVKILSTEGMLSYYVTTFTTKFSNTFLTNLDNTNQYEESDYNNQPSNNYVNQKTLKEAMLSLLLECASQPQPNLTQVIIGIPNSSYNIDVDNDSFFSSNLNDTNGIGIFSEIIKMLNTPPLSNTHHYLACFAYKLIYTLLKEPATKFYVSSFLRSKEIDFLHYKLVNIPTLIKDLQDFEYPVEFYDHYSDLASILDTRKVLSSSKNSFNSIYCSASNDNTLNNSLTKKNSSDPFLLISIIEQRAWILKAVALELYNSNSTEDSYVCKLLDVLFSQKSGNELDLYSNYHDSRFEINRSSLYSEDMQQPRMKMREFFNALRIKLNEPEQLLQDIKRFTTEVGFDLSNFVVNEHEFFEYKVNAIYAELQRIKKKILNSNSYSPQINESLNKEIQIILDRAIRFNNFTRIVKAQFNLLTGWSQTLQVVLLKRSRVTHLYLKENVFSELTQILFLTLKTPNLNKFIGSCLTSCIFMLFTQLRLDKNQVFQELCNSTTLDSSHLMDHNLKSSYNPLNNLLILPTEKLLHLFKLLLNVILSETNSSEMKIYLYSTLTLYLYYTNQDTKLHFGEINWQVNESLSNLINSSIQSLKVHSQDQQTRICLGSAKILNFLSNQLLDLLVSDIPNSSEFHKYILFSTLNCTIRHQLTVYSDDSQPPPCLVHLSKNGHLDYFLDLLVQEEDQKLIYALSPDSDSAGSIYTFENKILMLQNIAMLPQGSIMLLDSGIVKILSSLKIINSYQSSSSDLQTNSNHLISSKMRHDKIATVIMRIIVVLLTQLPQHIGLANQVIEWIQVHYNFVDKLLSEDSNLVHEKKIIQLELLTSIFYHLIYHHKLITEKLDKSALNYESLLLNLLTKYSNITDSEESQIKDTNLRKKHFLGLQRNLIGICRRLTSITTSLALQNNRNNETDSFLIKSRSALFSPTTVFKNDFSSVPLDKPSLSILIKLLNFNINIMCLLKEELLARYSTKNSNSQVRNNDFSEDNVTNFNYVLSNQHPHVQFALKKLHGLRVKMTIIYYNIENILFILWKHLAYFTSNFNNLNNKTQKKKDNYDLSKLTHDMSSSMETIITKLEKFEPLEKNKIHIIPIFIRKIKDVLKVD